jgi:hypothetical protein
MGPSPATTLCGGIDAAAKCVNQMNMQSPKLFNKFYLTLIRLTRLLEQGRNLISEGTKNPIFEEKSVWNGIGVRIF